MNNHVPFSRQNIDLTGGVTPVVGVTTGANKDLLAGLNGKISRPAEVDEAMSQINKARLVTDKYINDLIDKQLIPQTQKLVDNFYKDYMSHIDPLRKERVTLRDDLKADEDLKYALYNYSKPGALGGLFDKLERNNQGGKIEDLKNNIKRMTTIESEIATSAENFVNNFWNPNSDLRNTILQEICSVRNKDSESIKLSEEITDIDVLKAYKKLFSDDWASIPNIRERLENGLHVVESGDSVDNLILKGIKSWEAKKSKKNAQVEEEVIA